MKKSVGFLVAVAGLAVLALGLGTFKLDIPYINNFGSSTITIAGGALIVVGAVLSMRGEGGRKKIEQSKEEVPIYEGTGKKRRIVGYRRG